MPDGRGRELLERNERAFARRAGRRGCHVGGHVPATGAARREDPDVAYVVVRVGGRHVEHEATQGLRDIDDVAARLGLARVLRYRALIGDGALAVIHHGIRPRLLSVPFGERRLHIAVLGRGVVRRGKALDPVVGVECKVGFFEGVRRVRGRSEVGTVTLP